MQGVQSAGDQQHNQAFSRSAVACATDERHNVALADPAVAWSPTTFEVENGGGIPMATAYSVEEHSTALGADAGAVRVMKTRSLDTGLGCGATWSAPCYSVTANNNVRAQHSREAVDVELADVRDIFKQNRSPPCHGNAENSASCLAADVVSGPCASEIVHDLVNSADAAARDGDCSKAIELYQQALTTAPDDECIKQLLAAALQRRANPYAWLPTRLSGDTRDQYLDKHNFRDPYYFQSPCKYRGFDPEDIDAGLLGYARLLKACIYDFVDDNRFAKVLAALVLICIYDCAIPAVLQQLFDRWIPCTETEKIHMMLLAFVVSYPAYLYAHSWVISKPLDQVFVRNRLFRHALKMPWAFWNFEVAGGGGRDFMHGQISEGGNTANDAMVTSLITEDCNVVMDATCTAFDVFYTLIHLTCICVLVITGLKLPLIIAIPPLTVHLFTFVVIEYVAPRFLYHTNRRQLEYERCVKEVQESLRGAHALHLFNGESHSTQRMLTRLTDFDTHHFAAVKLRWQIEQLPDIIAQVLRLCTLFWGSWLLVHEKSSMTVGSLVGLLAALTGLGGDFTALAKHTMSLTRARPSLQRIYRFLDLDEVDEPSPHSLVRKSNNRNNLQKEQSRTEMLLARMDADPIVVISECSFSYGTWLLTRSVALSFEIESTRDDSSQVPARHGYLHSFLAMAGTLITVMSAFATLDPGNLDNGAGMDSCSVNVSDANATSGTAAASDDDLTKFEYLVIATYAGTVVFLTCGFAFFVKELSGLGWRQVIHCQGSDSTALRKSLAKHDQEILAETDFMGDIRSNSGNPSTRTRFSRQSRFSKQSREPSYRVRSKRASELRPSIRQSRLTTCSALEESSILQGLSMNISRGELVALCGEAAFGKTTIFRLLMKTNMPEIGRVNIHLGAGGVVAGVEQETFIFDTSIFENIRVGHPSANRELVRSAARTAGIHPKRDLNTACGVGGKLLSPAEAQRIGIARGCLRVMTAPDPSESLLVLDDPFSFQDPQSAGHITSRLRDFVTRGTSVIVLTQQTQLCAAADTVFVLEAGKLKASGAHDDLLQDQNLYSRIHSISQSFSVSSTGSVTKVRSSGLENYWIFAGLNSAERSAVAKAFEPQHFPAGHVIYKYPNDGEQDLLHVHLHELCIVTRGQVELVVGETDKQTVAVYGVGQIFGPNLSLMNLDNYAQIRCSKPTDVVALGTSSLEHLCRKFGVLQQAFDTCRDLRRELDTNEHLRQLWRGFETLTDVELEEVRMMLVTEVYSVGEWVCRQAREVDKLLLVVRGEVEVECGIQLDREVVGRGHLLGHVDLCDDARYFHGKPLFSFSARTVAPVVIIALQPLVFLELRESNDRFAAYIEREITQHALKARLPVHSMKLHQPQERKVMGEATEPGRSGPMQTDPQPSSSCVPRRQQELLQQRQPTRRRRRSITGLEVENGRVVLAQPATVAGARLPSEVCTAVFQNPLAAEAPF